MDGFNASREGDSYRLLESQIWSGKGAIGWDVEASYKDGEWEIIRNKTWIS